VKRLNEQAVLMVAAPSSAFEGLIDVMIEGVYDFLPDDADDHQLKLTMGRVADHARLRRRTDELERVLDLQNSVLRQRLQELALLNEMSHDLGSVPDLDEVLRRALRRILEAFDSRCGSFLILDAETGDLVVRAAAGPGAEKRLGQHRKLGEGVSGKVALERNPVLVMDVEKDSRFRDFAMDRRDGQGYRSASFIAVPLIHHGRLLGEMNVTEKETGEPFTADDLRLLSILGGHMASAISSALAAEELKRLNAALQDKMSSARESLRAAHERLTRAEGLTCAVASTMPAALAVFDSGLCVTFANEAAVELLGLAQGDCLDGLAASSGLAGLAGAAAEVVRQGCTRKLTAEGGGGQSGGQLRIVVTPLRLPDGSVSGAAVVATAACCPLLGAALDQGR